MLKKLLFVMNRSIFTALIILALSPLAQANKTSGRGTLNGSTISGNYSVSGSASINDTHIDALSVSGSANVTNSALSSARISGSAEMQRTKIAGTLSVSGSTQLISVDIGGNISISGSLDMSGGSIKKGGRVSGSANLSDLTVEQPLYVSGQLVAHDTHFDDITLSAEKAHLTGGSVQSILFTKNENQNDSSVMTFINGVFNIFRNHPAQQKLYLQDVDLQGTITFESGTGLVYTNDPRALEGKVTGGTVSQN